MLEEQMFDVLVLCETKLKEKGGCEFGCVSGRLSGVTRESARKEVALMVNVSVRQCVVEWKEVLSRLMRMKVQFG